MIITSLPRRYIPIRMGTTRRSTITNLLMTMYMRMCVTIHTIIHTQTRMTTVMIIIMNMEMTILTAREFGRRLPTSSSRIPTPITRLPWTLP